ncbi:MAG: hypothetical protein ACRD96_00855, partial [Bryobacteraceae bacterium]
MQRAQLRQLCGIDLDCFATGFRPWSSRHLTCPPIDFIACHSPARISVTILLLVSATGVIHVVTAVTTAKGQNMTTSTEETKTAQTTSSGKRPKATTKAGTRAHRAHVAPAQGKLGKKATPTKKTPTAPKNADPACGQQEGQG